MMMFYVLPPACENGWFRDHRARSGVAGGQPGGQSSLVWTFLANLRTEEREREICKIMSQVPAFPGHTPHNPHKLYQDLFIVHFK